ncbi:50S ribosomal protein L30e [Sulfodiicoccus acidiphilus]|uniref:Large ribosomal subunit protein eL30 n=1 Tax=Sulfodiicoccus acidiphilus TaxID=1670455 RepID=A0A348B0E6_9CREN|nr:50S ribosomal protein L30e [Sulfodiicoccus acidiphilus]BBD71648.1 50S ribosomal protein L30e [Sulfodiicoccus acidiphilus]GGT86872.1 50S ribosomal protein L30e [Sulfodiicoccus acidiphilus]
MSQSVSFESELKRLLKTGKVVIGTKESLNVVAGGKAKMLIISSYLKEELREELKRHAELSNVPIYEYAGSGWELGTLCGKPYMISTMAITDFGDSRMEQLAKR